MSTRLHIIMPSNRPQNIPTLAPHYLQNMEPHPWELRWHILSQGPDADPKGINKTNEALTFIKDGWLMMMSDDTYSHPALYRRLAEVILAHPGVGCVVFSQQRGAGHVLVACPENMRPNYVCGSQVVWNRQFLGDDKYDSIYGGISDGVLVSHVYRRDPGRFVFIPEVLTYFGRLEW